MSKETRDEYTDADGVRYQAWGGAAFPCLGCAHEHADAPCLTSPECEPKNREDGRDVIWVEASK